MVYSSEQIAAINAGYAQQNYGNLQYAHMIGMGNPMAENITGGAINRMGAIGGPAAMAGLGIMGLDPMSLGLRAGMGAYGAGAGFAGAGIAGLGAGGLASAGLMAAGYGANQMFSGAQQQQSFNANMNSTYRFANSAGGFGFGRGGLGEIGSTLRTMTTEQGSGGQMVGFEELGRLASNMGRMGMAQGVRDAKDFSDKFRQMVKTVKEIAEQMGTSLEEAQKMMGAMRSSGVFGLGRAGDAATRIRAGAAAGGLATSEVTGMMSVGSQISRAVGGRGRSGAIGGIETITNIGVAQQMGLLSEEDIYNATGLTGAEGRRALATRQMEQSARFLQGSLGRRFLASVTGRNGQLDEGSVQEMLAGGVGTDRTMAMAGRNLDKVGRANFIRNEGRLRGAALEKFGGMAPMIAMRGWLQERGINVNEDNDRAMIFMQRELGMGNDEAETMLKQVQELPQLMRQRQIAGEDDRFSRRMSERSGQVGIEGIKRKFEKARAEVNATLQQAGATFYEGVSEQVDRAINDITGVTVRETRKDVAEAFRAMMGGGAMGQAAAGATFGLGGQGTIARSSKDLLGKGPSDMETFQKFDAESFKNAGFAFKGGSLTEHMNQMSLVSNAFKGGDRGLQDRGEVQTLGRSAGGAVREAFARGTISGRGLDRLQSFGTFLRGQSGLGDLAERFSRASPVEKAQIMAAFTGEGGAGVAGEAENFASPETKGIYGASNLSTLGQGAEAVGNALMPQGVGGGLLAAATLGLSDMYTRGASRAAGRFLLGDEGRSVITGIMSGDASTRQSMREHVLDEVKKLRDKGTSITDGEKGRLRGLQSALFAQRLTEMRNAGASADAIQAEAERMAKENGLSVTDVTAGDSVINSLAVRNEQQARLQGGERFGERAREELASMARGGLVTGSGRDLQLSQRGQELGNTTAGKAFLSALFQTQKSLSQIGPGTAPGAVQALEEQARGTAGEMDKALSSMSVAEQRAFAERLRGVEGMEGAAGEVGRTAAIGGELQAGSKRGKFGGMRSAASLLGVDISQDELKTLVGKGGAAGAAAEIAKRLGGGLDKNEAFMKQLTGTLSDVGGGKFGAAGVELKGLLDTPEMTEIRKKKIQAQENADPNKNLEKISEYTKRSADRLDTIFDILAAGDKVNPEDVK
jgi:hypothetical protein